MPERKHDDGHSHGLSPLVPLDLSRVNSVGDLVTAMKDTAFGARQVGEAAEILHTMGRDPDCLVVCSLSGAMTVAKMGLVLCEMIEHGLVDVIVSTGALISHGFVEAMGDLHFKYDPSMNDQALFEVGYARVYDTIELEKNLLDVENVIKEVMNELPGETVLCSREVCERLGKHLAEKTSGRGILSTAFRKGVPVYIPAFTDSEVGMDFAILNEERKKAGLSPFQFDPFLDLEDFTERILKAKTAGVFTVGGGVPRNWAQQIGPYIEALARIGVVESGAFFRYKYGVRICPEPVHWGGLSGCTYREGVSWGKFDPQESGGRFAEVYSDATIAWPLIVKAVLERIEKESSPAPLAKGGRGD